MPGGPEDDALEAALGLGELAGLTVNNEADPLSYDVGITPLNHVTNEWKALKLHQSICCLYI